MTTCNVSTKSDFNSNCVLPKKAISFITASALAAANLISLPAAEAQPIPIPTGVDFRYVPAHSSPTGQHVMVKNILFQGPLDYAPSWREVPAHDAPTTGNFREANQMFSIPRTDLQPGQRMRVEFNLRTEGLEQATSRNGLMHIIFAGLAKLESTSNSGIGWILGKFTPFANCGDGGGMRMQPEVLQQEVAAANLIPSSTTPNHYIVTQNHQAGFVAGPPHCVHGWRDGTDYRIVMDFRHKSESLYAYNTNNQLVVEKHFTSPDEYPPSNGSGFAAAVIFGSGDVAYNVRMTNIKLSIH